MTRCVYFRFVMITSRRVMTFLLKGIPSACYRGRVFLQVVLLQAGYMAAEALACNSPDTLDVLVGCATELDMLPSKADAHKIETQTPACMAIQCRRISSRIYRCMGQVGGRSGFQTSQGNRLRCSSILMACMTFGCLTRACVDRMIARRMVQLSPARPRRR